MNLFLLLFFAVVSLTVVNAAVISPKVSCVSVAANGDVTLSWIKPVAASTDSVTYKIYSSGGCCSGFKQIGNIPDYNINFFTYSGANATNNRIYYYVTSEYRNNGKTIAATPLDTVSSIYLTVTKLSSAIGKLSWNPVFNKHPATQSYYYKIYRDFPVPRTLVDSTTSLNYIDTVKVCNRIINYKIEIADAAGCNSTSNNKASLFQSDIKPITPILDSVSVTKNNQTAIAWQKSISKDVIGYIVYKHDGAIWQPIDTVKGRDSTHYLYKNATPDQKSEWYCIAAFDSCNLGSQSDLYHQTIFAELNYIPCDLTTEIKWTNYINWPSGVSEFRIYASKDGAPEELVGTVGKDVFSFKHKSLTVGSRYCYYVRAFDGDLQFSSASNSRCIKATKGVEPLFNYLATATVVADNNIQVKAYVDNKASVTAYKIERADNVAGPYKEVGIVPANKNANTITYNDITPQTSAASYYYRVICIDSCGYQSQTSNYGRTILLTVNANADMTNTISWNDYEGWLGKVEQYELYRISDGIPDPKPIQIFLSASGSVVDDVSAMAQGSGRFSYFIKAIEGTGNLYNLKETSLSNIVEVYQDSYFFIPNAFAPYGENRIFKPSGSFFDQQEFSMLIYNRWGEVVFKSDNPTIGWDGNYKGDMAQQGVYVYHIKYKIGSGEYIERTGAVTLIGGGK